MRTFTFNALFLLFSLSLFCSFCSALPTISFKCDDDITYGCAKDVSLSGYYYWCQKDVWQECPGGATCDRERGDVACQKNGTAFYGKSCGDGICAFKETCEECPSDCECDVCGDGVCGDKETCLMCPNDCGECRSEYKKCGNNICDDGEDCSVCPYDCGICSLYACSETTCNLPDCRCANNLMPKYFPKEDMPQFVYLSYDDAITLPVYDVLRELTDGFNAYDTSECPPKAVHFLSNDNTNYFLLQDLIERYHSEIASHTITHSTSTDTDAKRWFQEIEYGRSFTSEMAIYPKKEIVGFRAPYFAYNPYMFTVLEDLNYTYDSSISSQNRPGEQYWPYTLDYGTSQICFTGTCPEVSIRGLWEFPINVLYDGDSALNVLDPSLSPENGQLLDLFKKNFLDHYKGNKSPFGVIIHPAWLLSNKNRIGVLQEFFKFAANHSNVFFRSPKEIIEWMKNPIPASEMKGVNCTYKDRNRNTCPDGTQPLYCKFQDKDRFFHTCFDDCYLTYPSTSGQFQKQNTPVEVSSYTFTYLEDSTLPKDDHTNRETGDEDSAKSPLYVSMLILTFVTTILL